MGQKRIWHLLSNRWNSAITEYALSSAKALRKIGHKNFFTPLANSPAHKRSENSGLEIHPIKKFSLSELFELRKISKLVNADCIIVYGGPETFLARFLDHSHLCRFIGQSLNTNVLRIPFLFSSSYSHVKKFFVPNKIIYDQLEEKTQKPLRKIALGIDGFHYSPRSSLNSECIVLGRLDPVKGHEHILKIFSLVLKNWPKNVERPLLHIIGENANLDTGDLLKTAQLDSLVLGKDFKLTNQRVHDIQNILRHASVGIIPSLGSEHICRVAEEFLLLGTPIFVSGAGATEETLFEGAGDSYRDCDDNVAAQKLTNFIINSRKESPSQREQRALKASELFSLETMGRSLEEFILS